jgi:hypothetical protein
MDDMITFFDLEDCQIPMFRLFGTAPEHKRHVAVEAGHFVPKNDLAREVLDWLDRYLGPVERGTEEVELLPH